MQSTDSTDVLWPSWKNSNTEAFPTENQEVHPSLADPAPVPSYSDLPESLLPLSRTKEESSSGAAPLLHLTDKPANYNVQSNVRTSVGLAMLEGAIFLVSVYGKGCRNWRENMSLVKRTKKYILIFFKSEMIPRFHSPISKPRYFSLGETMGSYLTFSLLS